MLNYQTNIKNKKKTLIATINKEPRPDGSFRLGLRTVELAVFKKKKKKNNLYFLT